MPGPETVGEDRRKSILDFIRQYVAEHGVAPTLREIARAADLQSTNYVHVHLGRLVEEGFLAIESRRWRGITLISPAPDGWTKGGRRDARRPSAR